MLEEFKNVSQPARTKGYRRWFSDDQMDLILWYTPEGVLHGFQLCYDRDEKERAFTWDVEGTLTHTAVDSGESSPLRNDAPILVPDGIAPVARVLEEFRRRAAEVDPEVVALVTSKISAFGKPAS